MWLAYMLSVAFLHFILLVIPGLSVPVVWTLTNVIYNLVSQARDVLRHYLSWIKFLSFSIV